MEKENIFKFVFVTNAPFVMIEIAKSYDIKLEIVFLTKHALKVYQLSKDFRSFKRSHFDFLNIRGVARKIQD